MSKLRKILFLLLIVLLPCVFACQNPSDTKLEEVTFSNIVTSMTIGDTLEVAYSKQENVSAIFVSSDANVATVEGNVVTAVGVGTFTLTGTFTLGEVSKEYEFTIEVKEAVVEKTSVINYELDGGVNPQDAPAEYKEGEGVTLPNPTKEGYEFLGWSLEKGSASYVTSISATQTCDVTVYANWKEKECNVHNFLNWTISKEPTCYEDGLESSACNECGYVMTKELKALGCSYGDWTSINNGIHIRICLNDNGHKQMTHCIYGEWITVTEAGPFTEGLEKHVCVDCGYTETRVIPSTHVHSYSNEFTIDKEPTCTEKGIKSKHCTKDNCSSVIETVIPSLGHSYSKEWIIDLESTYDNIGYKSKHCTRDNCNEKIDVTEIPIKPYSDGLLFALNSTKTGYIVTGIGDCTDIEIKITPIYNNLPVLEINSRAFYNCTSLTSITIPDSVTSIGKNAFYGCTSLTSISIPFVGNTLNGTNNTHFGDIFGSSSYIPSSLKEVIITGGESIGTSAFSGCANLTNITILDSVTSIGEKAFKDCTSLTSITIPDSVVSIGDYAFYGCSKLNVLQIGTSVTSIGNSAFYNCKSLESITIPENVVSIGTSAFSGCANLTNITILDSVISIGEKAFKDCTSLTSITIPDSVVSIGDYAFYGCSKLNVLQIGTSVTSIGNYSFSKCKSLTSVIIPESVTSIGYSAFDGCTSLESITIPFVGNTLDGTNSTSFEWIFGSTSFSYGVPKSLKEVIITGGKSIGDYSFNGCTNLESITIPDSITSIGVDAFANCISLTNVYYKGDITDWLSINFNDSNSNPMRYNAKLHMLNENNEFNEVTSITIPETVTSIGNYTFYNCTSLTNITILGDITSIGDVAFGYCKSLESITLPKSVTNIGDYAFYNCENLTSLTISESETSIKISESETSIGNYAFSGCTSLTSITIPENVTSIGKNAFEYCTSLTSITISENVVSIGDSAFSSCDNLNTLHIATSVKSIGKNAFEFCTSLTNVYYKGNIINWLGINFINWYSTPMYHDAKLYMLNENNEFCELTSITIPESVTSIGNYTFYNFTSLTSITIPDSVTSIGNYAFYNCKNLTNAYYKGDITDWLSINFNDENSNPMCNDAKLYMLNENNELCEVTSITIPDGVRSIGNYAFYNCTSLINITISESVTSIGNYSFSKCKSLTSIAIPDSVTSIGNSAFYNCKSLESITIPKNVTSIGDYTFYNCSSLTSVIIPDSVTSIGDSSFRDCTSLTSITIPESIISIGESLFRGCTSLTSITIPESIISIGESLFRGCTSLTSIAIPDSVTSIGKNAFYNCTSLINITIPESVTSIGDYSFTRCQSLELIYYRGTESNWNSINKNFYWDNGASNYDLRFVPGNLVRVIDKLEETEEFSAKLYDSTGTNLLYEGLSTYYGSGLENISNGMYLLKVTKGNKAYEKLIEVNGDLEINVDGSNMDILE